MTARSSHAAGVHAGHLLVLEALWAARLGIVVLDGELRVVGATEAVCELLGYRKSELLGRSVAELVHRDDRGWAQTELELLIARGIERIRREVRLIAPDQSEIWSELNVRCFDTDRTAGSVVAVAILEDARDRALREHELRRFADTDPLTDLFNRRRFTAELERHLAWGARYGARGSLLLLDIDRLKTINDTYGHLAGDNVIRTTASVLRSHSRASDLVARLGGDEFAMLLPAADANQAATVASVLTGAAASTHVEPVPMPLTLSVGITTIDQASSVDVLMEQAERALYAIKHAGGDGYRVRREQPLPPPVHAFDPRRRQNKGSRAVSNR